MSKNLAQVFATNPVSTMSADDLLYLAQHATTDGGITFTNFLNSIAASIQNQSFNYALDTGTANHYVVSLTPAPTFPFVVGLTIIMKAAHANAVGTSDIAINGHAVVPIFMADGQALKGAEIRAGVDFILIYNGTYFQLVNPAVIGWSTGTVVDLVGIDNVLTNPITTFFSVNISSPGRLILPSTSPSADSYTVAQPLVIWNDGAAAFPIIDSGSNTVIASLPAGCVAMLWNLGGGPTSWQGFVDFSLASTASAARTNLGLGTIATQNANAVAITGGTIDNTVVGGVTPTFGTFSTVSYTKTIMNPQSGFSGSFVTGENIGLQTTNATPTVLVGIILGQNEAIIFRGSVLGSTTTHANTVGGSYEIVAQRQSGGNITVVGSPYTNIFSNSAATFAVTVDTGTQNVWLLITGVAATTYNWVANFTWQYMDNNL